MAFLLAWQMPLDMLQFCMEQIVKQIVKTHNELWGESPTIKKIEIGFTNTIFCVADKYILKICHDINNESEFCVEVDFYTNNIGKPYIAKMFAYSKDKSKVPYMYIVTEKIDGVSLYSIWHTLTEQEREKIVNQICDILKDLHKNKGEHFDWSEYIKGYYEQHLDVLIKQKQLTESELALVRKAMSKFDLYLETDKDKFVYIHNDLHYDNCFYKDGKLTIIDFESSRFAPIDKELEIVFYAAKMPDKHASRETERFAKKEHFATLVSYFKKHYPQMFDVPHLEKRIAIYHLRDALDQYGTFKDNTELHDIIIELAKFVCE